MNFAQFRKELRLNRGKLASMHKEMGIIFLYGSNAFKEYALKEKHIGVAKMADIAESLDYKAQDELIKWIRCNRADVKAIELKFVELQEGKK